MQPSYRQFPQQPVQRSPHATAQRRGMVPMVSSAQSQTAPIPAQMPAQHENQRQTNELSKRRSRKPTDKNIPDGIEECVIGDGVQRYKELRDLERKLDAIMMRKRLDIQDARNRDMKRYRILRVWISNTVEEQPWQGDGLDVNAFDFSTNMDSSYKVKIEGKLLGDDDDVDEDDSDAETDIVTDLDAMDEDTVEKKSTKSRQAAHQYRFSHFFKSLTVDFERSRTKDNADQSVEWKKPVSPPNATNPPAAADFDQLEFKRGGDENVNITINLVRDEIPERYALSSALSEIMDTHEATRAEAVTAIWEYIKVMGLQEDDEKRSFRCDELLKAIFQRDTGYVPFIPDAVIPHMMALPPIKLPYTIRVDQAFHADPQPTVYDIRVSLPDPLLAKLHTFRDNPNYYTTLREIGSYNDQLAVLVQALGQSKAKHTFLTSLSKDPGNFVRKWMSSQKRDLEVMMGEATRGAGEDASGEEFRRGGKDGVWGSEHVRESVNLLLSARTR